MSDMYIDNDGRFPDESRALVRYPLTNEHVNRATWPWAPGTVLGQCGPDDWHVRVDVDDLAEAGESGKPWYPCCFRGVSELDGTGRISSTGRMAGWATR
jgi:hypothetical protein